MIEEEKQSKCDNCFAKFVVTPYDRYLIVWNIVMTLLYLVAIIIDSLVIGFHLELLLVPKINICQSIFSAVMILDIVLKFSVAIRNSQTEDEEADEEEKEEEDIYERRSAKVAALEKHSQLLEAEGSTGVQASRRQ